MGKFPKCDENSIKKGAWTPEEDHKLAGYINKHGHGSWRALAKLAGLNRCGKSCRLRWTNYLRPGIKRGKFSNEEEQTIMHLHSLLGNKWSTIASHLPGRTDNEIKNFWNTRLRKKLIQMDLDPMTHKPRTDIFASLNHLLSLANLEYLIGQLLIQQEALMLQKEAFQMANLQQLHEYHLESNITDVDAPSLLNSYPESVSAQGFRNEVSINTIENANELLANNHIALAPESPFSFQKPTCNNSQTNTSSFPSSYFPLPISQSNTSLNNAGDAETTSASSYDGGELWPMNWSDLYFEEPFLHDIV